MLPDRLKKAWDDRRGSTPVEGTMRFAGEGLVLGAGTVLVPAGETIRDIAVDPSEPRLQALLTAAHRRRPTKASLTHLRRAAECWRDGDDALAAMHLVLSQLDRLRRPEQDAQRLFLADSMLAHPVDADAILEVLESSDAANDELGKRYNSDEPRVPPGSGRSSGQWTAGDNPSAQPRAEFNPDTVTTVGNTKGSYQGDDACYRARRDCQVNVKRDQWRGQANNNLNQTYYDQCSVAEDVCVLVDFAVERTPFFRRGGVLYPDGGVVLVNKGQAATYYPREIASMKWPYRSRPSQR